MKIRKLPFTSNQIHDLLKSFPTPFYLYDEAGIRSSARKLNQIFDWVDQSDGIGYLNYFAVKATPNPHIMSILADEGMGADASSGPEIELSQAIGLKFPYIMYTANNPDPREYFEANNAGAIINLDDINQIPILTKALSGKIPETISFRYNPGNKKSTGVNDIIGIPEDSKFGIPDQQLVEAYQRAQNLGSKYFGIHTMLVSNELDSEQHIITAQIIFEKVLELSLKLGITFKFVNLGGGLGIPYKINQQEVDYLAMRKGIKSAYQNIIIKNGLSPLRVVTENGRYLTGPNGFLVTKVRSIKNTFHRYVGLDASMSDLMRPGMYDAYHEITVLDKPTNELVTQRVVGSLCENNDHFTGSITKDRDLPIMEDNDIVIIHDTGAHGHAMGFNYNGKLRSAEILLRTDGSFQQIRRAETRKNLFSTLDFPGL